MVGADAASGSSGWKIPAPVVFSVLWVGSRVQPRRVRRRWFASAARGRGSRAGGARIIDVLKSPEHAPRNICLRRHAVKIEIVKCLKYWVAKRPCRQLL